MIDWQQAVLNIKAAGVPLARASRELGKGNDFLRFIKDQYVKSPKFEDGLLILRYHLRVCGREKHREILR